MVEIDRQDDCAVIKLNRGKVHAINEELVEKLSQSFEDVRVDDTVNGIIFTGQGSFFSFGFDVPEMLTYSKARCRRFLTAFTDMLTRMFMFPKPVVGALNGHTIAGGCMLALTCDSRVMVSGRPRISLNEITFGASVFAGATAMLSYTSGTARAQEIVYGGEMYTAEEARELGLVSRVTTSDELMKTARNILAQLTAKDRPTFASIKRLMRAPVADDMKGREAQAIDEFIKIWYSNSTREQLKNITIRE